MNERIFDMARQKGATDEQGNRAENVFCFTKDELKAFAELLIRECMGIISDESEKVSDEWQCKDGKHIWWKIKEHFGVE